MIGTVTPRISLSDDSWLFSSIKKDNGTSNASATSRWSSVRVNPGVTRILFLGDSVTYGTGLSQGLTIPDRLEVQLNESGTGRVEVLNAGVPGYSTFQSERYLPCAARRSSPISCYWGFVSTT